MCSQKENFEIWIFLYNFAHQNPQKDITILNTFEKHGTFCQQVINAGMFPAIT